MDYRTFERKLLETIFTTDVPITPATVAYLYKISTEEAAGLLQRAAVAGVVEMESDDQGNLIYRCTNRPKLAMVSQAQIPEAGRFWEAENQRAPMAATPYQDPYAQSMAQSQIPSVPFLGAPVDPSSGQGMDSRTTATGFQDPTYGAPGAKMVSCPFCFASILVGTKKCPQCHEFLDYALREMYGRKNYLAPQAPNRAVVQTGVSSSSVRAGLLSFFMPGLGQMTSGSVASGVLWLLITCLGYVLYLPGGMILHLLSIIDAEKKARKAREEEAVTVRVIQGGVM